MPGVFVIDRSGVIRYAHRNKDVADNPPNDELLDAIARIHDAGCLMFNPLIMRTTLAIDDELLRFAEGQAQLAGSR